MWAFEDTFYQIYPIGFTGAPRVNDGKLAHRILKVKDFIPHLEKLGVRAVLFNPLFESIAHGYDTTDMTRVDCRLGTNEDFAEVSRALHAAGMKVLLDGVLNHVGRDFFAFRDVREKKWDSRYTGWFNISFDGNTGYNDGFWYEAWEGHYELVKLNLRNREVRDFLFDCVRRWIREFDIDGLRLDVAYCLDRDFMRELRQVTGAEKRDFFLMGEALFGDYNPYIADGMLDSVTNYECYKGIYSSINNKNFFEISFSYNRQFGSEPWCLYRGRHLFSFIDNHDVSRIASRLDDPANLPVAWGLLFAMPGIPCIYYGSEWGMKGRKEDGDDALRPAVETPEWNETTDLVRRLIEIRDSVKALVYGGYRNVQVTNRQLVFERKTDGECVYALFNLEDTPFTVCGDYLRGRKTELVENKSLDLDGRYDIPPHSVRLLRG